MVYVESFDKCRHHRDPGYRSFVAEGGSLNECVAEGGGANILRDDLNTNVSHKPAVDFPWSIR